MSAISNEPHLTGLVSEFMSPLGHVESHAEFQPDRRVDLDLKTGTALGLIVTELVSNGLKHAFPDDGAGKISLAPNEIDDSTLERSVTDDGVDLPQNV